MQPMWYEATALTGQLILLMLFEEREQFKISCIFDLDSESALTPTIERMVELDSEGSANGCTTGRSSFQIAHR